MRCRARPAARLAFEAALLEGDETMTTAEARKRMRGTKRVCSACAAPFYDLARDPIVCPTCGAHYTPEAQPEQNEGTPAFARKAAWSAGSKRQYPAAPAASTADEPAGPD